MVLPLFFARRRMPAAALADSEYLGGTSCAGCSISPNEGSEDEHTPSALRHSEESAIKSAPGHAIPEVGQRFKDGPKVSTAVTREETGNIFEQYMSWFEKGSDSCELKEQSRTFSFESCSLPGDGEVLARKATAE